MRRLLASVAAAWLVACGGSRVPSPAPIESPAEDHGASDEKDRAHPEKRQAESLADQTAERRVGEMLARVAEVRTLEAQAKVASRVLGREALLERVREHVAEEVPAEAIRGQGEILVALGLVPPGFDYEGAIFRLLESQLAGFYEPSEKVMYLAADLSEEAAKATLAHELVHALQDQHWDLGPRLAYEPGGGDAQSAVHALAEGDATSAMMDVVLAELGKSALDLPDRAFALEAEMSIGAGADLSEIPRVLRASLVAPYVDGLAFVHALRRQGGWAAVDAAWRSPPGSTEQLLHVDKYEARERPEVLPPPPPPPGAGWRVAHEEVLGEQGVRLVLEEWAPLKVARVAAAGWGGDRATLYHRGPESERSFALLWHLRFDEGNGRDPNVEAREAYEAFARSVGAPKSGSRFCRTREGGGTLAIVRVGRDVVVAAGPYRHTADHIEQQTACAETLGWASRVLTRNGR